MRWARAALCFWLGLVEANAQRPGSEHVELTPARQAQRWTRELELPERCGAAWCALVALGPPAVAPLLAATGDPRPDVAVRAVWVLGLLRQDGAEALPRLRALAAGGDATLATAATWAIDRIAFRGRLLVDYQVGEVVQLGDDGQELRKLEGLRGPWHAEPVGDGRILVSEYNGDCVREFDAAGKEVWQFAGLKNPYGVQRLPDGHTLIADASHGRVVEVSRDGKVVRETKELRRPVWVRRLPDGHMLVVEQQGDVIEYDAAGKDVHRVSGLQTPMSVERLLDGGLLVTVHNDGLVLDLAAGVAEPRASVPLPLAQSALRRRDGHTLVGTTSAWVEFDRDGKEVWRRPGRYAVGVFW